MNRALDPEVFEGIKGIPKDNGSEVDERFLRCILDQLKDYPPPAPVLNLIQDGDTMPLLTLKSFSLWQGKQKSKKTTALAMAIAPYIANKPSDESQTYFQPETPGRVLWFDTEQGQSYAARTMKLILKLAGVDKSDKLIYCDLREYTPRERLEIIISGISTTQDLGIVIIDGLVDLLDDFMDAKQGHTLITTLLKLCSQHNIHIAGVLHQNKSKDDKSARAHVGTIASQKCEVEISTEADTKDLSVSKVTCLNSRGIPFKDFLIRWQKGSLPAIIDKGTEVMKPNKNYAQAVSLQEAVFKPMAALTPTEAEKAIMKHLTVSESTAKRRIDELLTWGLIEKGEDRRYRGVGVRVHEGSNRVQ